MKCRVSSGSSLFAKTKLIFKATNTICFFEIIKLLYIMDHSDFTVCIMDNSIGPKRVKVSAFKVKSSLSEM